MIRNIETHTTVEIEVYKHGGSWGRRKSSKMGEKMNLQAINKGFKDLMNQQFVIDFLKARNIHIEQDPELGMEHWSDVEDFEDFNDIVDKVETKEGYTHRNEDGTVVMPNDPRWDGSYCVEELRKS